MVTNRTVKGNSNEILHSEKIAREPWKTGRERKGIAVDRKNVKRRHGKNALYRGGG